PTKRAQEMTDMLISGINQILTRRGVPGCAYGRASIFKTFIGKEAPRLARLDFSNLQEDTATLLQGTPIAKDLRKGRPLKGVALMRVAGFVSAAHTPELIAESVQACDCTIPCMQQQGLLI